jgi:hypothetical protein
MFVGFEWWWLWRSSRSGFGRRHRRTLSRSEAGPVCTAFETEGGQLGLYRGDEVGILGPLGNISGAASAMFEGTTTLALL